MTKNEADRIRAALERYEKEIVRTHRQLSDSLKDIIKEVDSLQRKLK